MPYLFPTPPRSTISTSPHPKGAEPLAFLFDVLGLDCRLRHHRRALTPPEKAEVLRSMAGELQRGISEAKAPWCGALLREMTCCLLEMCPGEGMEGMEGFFLVP